jgi:predicted CopG family antitoxin
MTATTISISIQTRNKIREFGFKGETYDDIINRLYESACKKQLYDILMDDSDTISLEELREKIENK